MLSTKNIAEEKDIDIQLDYSDLSKYKPRNQLTKESKTPNERKNYQKQFRFDKGSKILNQSPLLQKKNLNVK